MPQGATNFCSNTGWVLIPKRICKFHVPRPLEPGLGWPNATWETSPLRLLRSDWFYFGTILTSQKDKS